MNDPIALPNGLVVTNGAMAMDGGSIGLECLGDGRTISIALDWSMSSRRRGASQLLVGGHAVPRGTPIEASWLALLEHAELEHHTGFVGQSGVGSRTAALSSDITEYFASIQQSPRAALARLVSELVSHVRSAEYQSSPGAGPPQDPLADVRKLLLNGQRSNAIRAYRTLYSTMSLAEAISAIDKLISHDEKA